MVEKIGLKSLKKGLKSGKDYPKLSNTEEDVLFLLTKETLNVSQVALRRNRSPQSVYKIRKQLIKKGLYSPYDIEVEKVGGCLNQFRLHNEQYHINIIWQDHKYKKRLNHQENKRLDIDGNSVMLYKNSIDIYSNNSFFGNTVDESESKSLRYWYRIFRRVENELKIIIMKDRHDNVTRVRADYAETNNELATHFIKEDQRIRVTGEDGICWLVIDNSFGLKELETTHPRRSKADMKDVVNPFFEDLRNNNPDILLPSQLVQIIKEIALHTRENAASINSLALVLKSQIPETTVLPPPRNERVDYVG